MKIGREMNSFSRFGFRSLGKCMFQASATSLYIGVFGGLYFFGFKYYLKMLAKSSLEATLGLF